MVLQHQIVKGSLSSTSRRCLDVFWRDTTDHSLVLFNIEVQLTAWKENHLFDPWHVLAAVPWVACKLLFLVALSCFYLIWLPNSRALQLFSWNSNQQIGDKCVIANLYQTNPVLQPEISNSSRHTWPLTSYISKGVLLSMAY